MGYDIQSCTWARQELGVDLRGVRWSSSPSPRIVCIKQTVSKMFYVEPSMGKIFQFNEDVSNWLETTTSSPWLCLKSKKNVPLENSRWFKVTIFFQHFHSWLFWIWAPKLRRNNLRPWLDKKPRPTWQKPRLTPHGVLDGTCGNSWLFRSLYPSSRGISIRVAERKRMEQESTTGRKNKLVRFKIG